MIINRNTLGHLEVPPFILCKASEERIGILKCTSKNWAHKYNDLDTLSFEIPCFTDGVKTEFYGDIDVMKYIEVPTIGRFCIKDISIMNEGQQTEYKKIECQDYSSILSTRYLESFEINTGLTGAIDKVKFYQPGDQAHSLMHLVLEKFPEWSCDHVDPSLWTMQRSFEVTRQDVYSFMTGEISEAFSCIFIFNTLSKTINVYDSDNFGKDTNVHVSYNNLLQKTEMNYSTDEIKTALKLEGADGLSVREINMGYDMLYDFSYYADEEFMSTSLLNAYNAWKNLVSSAVDLNLFTSKAGVITRAELSGKSYKDAYTLLLSKYQKYYTDISRWTSTLIPYKFNTRYIGYGTISYTEDGSDAVTFERQTSTVLVDALPSSGNANTLYLVKNTYNMYRWNGSWFNVNEWKNCCLNSLKEKQAAAANSQSVAMKAGYGNPDDLNETHKKRYVDTYLPAMYQYNAITKQIEVVNSTLSTLEANQAIIQTDKTVIINKTAMKNNFNAAQLKELSTFIREDELSSDNYVVTDVMTETERFDMLYDMLAFGQKELAKKAVPEIQFSVDMMNLYALPEFDNYSGDFDLANYVWVTLRDDYSIKAKILEVSIDFLDQSSFEVVFGNIARQARNIFTDITEAMNTATSAATSVSFGASNWSAAAEQTDSIGQALADGLLSQSYYLANAEDNETRIDENGVWITTTTGDHGRDNTDNYDAIYLGGGRILFTQDGWRTVAMSVGRADVNMPHIVDGNIVFQIESKFGTFADFLIAGYIGGSLIVGGDLYSDGYTTSSDKNSGNYGTHLDLKEGTFEFNSPQSFKQSGKPGKKRLRLYTDTANDGDVLEVNGVIHAKEGNIGSDDNGEGGFIIKHEKFYMTKDSFNAGNNGVYIGFDSHVPSTQGISLGIYNGGTRRNPFSVDVTGYLTSTSGYIGGFNIDDKKLYYSTKNSFDSNVQGVYIGFDGSDDSKKGIALGKYNSSTNRSPFSVDINGYLHAEHGEIGGFTITHNSIYKDKDSMDSTADGIYIGNDGIALRNDNRFMVDTVRNKAKIAGFDFTSSAIYKDKTGIDDTEHDGIYIGTDGIALRNDNRFMVDVRRNKAKIAGFDFTSSSLYKDKSSIDAQVDGIYIGTDGIALRNDNRFMVDVRRNTAKIAGFDFTSSSMYKDKLSLYAENSGVYIGTDGISLGLAGAEGDRYTPFSVTSSGVLTARSGTIGGWTIDRTQLKSSNVTINSSGSIYQGDLYGENSNWGITNGGYAYFKDVYVNGVRNGSEFGNMGITWDGTTWGGFAGGSSFSSDLYHPLGGTVEDHVGDIIVDTVTADYVYARAIDAGFITAETIETTYATIDNLDAAVADIGTLTADFADLTTVVAGKVDADQVTAITADVLDSWNGTLRCGDLYVGGSGSFGLQYIVDGDGNRVGVLAL